MNKKFLTIAAALLISPITANAITVTWDELNQTVLRPASGSTVVDFFATVSHYRCDTPVHASSSRIGQSWRRIINRWILSPRLNQDRSRWTVVRAHSQSLPRSVCGLDGFATRKFTHSKVSLSLRIIGAK